MTKMAKIENNDKTKYGIFTGIQKQEQLLKKNKLMICLNQPTVLLYQIY